MKKFLPTAILCLTLTAFLTACGTDSTKTSEDNKTTTSQSSKDNKEEYISLDTMKAVPQFKLKDVNGKDVSNEIFKDKKYTLITFWGTW